MKTNTHYSGRGNFAVFFIGHCLEAFWGQAPRPPFTNTIPMKIAIFAQNNPIMVVAQKITTSDFHALPDVP